MYISDVVRCLDQVIRSGKCDTVELAEYFDAVLRNDRLDLPSRCLVAIGRALAFQMFIEESLFVEVESALLVHLILSHNHALSGSEVGPGLSQATKLPTKDGKLQFAIKRNDNIDKIIVDKNSTRFRFIILSSVSTARAVLDEWLNGGSASCNLAMIIKSPLSEFDPLSADLQPVQHRVAGWLNVTNETGAPFVVAAIVLGNAPNAI